MSTDWNLRPRDCNADVSVNLTFPSPVVAFMCDTHHQLSGLLTPSRMPCSRQAVELLQKLAEDKTWQSRSPHYGTKAARDLLDAAQRQIPVSVPSVKLPSVNLPSIRADSVQLPSVQLPSFSAPSVQLPKFAAGDFQHAAARISEASCSQVH